MEVSFNYLNLEYHKVVIQNAPPFPSLLLSLVLAQCFLSRYKYQKHRLETDKHDDDSNKNNSHVKGKWKLCGYVVIRYVMRLCRFSLSEHLFLQMSSIPSQQSADHSHKTPNH